MLGADIKALFELYGERFVNDLVQRMNDTGVNATGAGARSIRYKATQRKLTISSLKYLEAVDTGLNPSDFKRGRKPSTTNNGLERWVKAKVRPDLDGKNLRRLTFAIAETIKQNGTIKGLSYKGADLVDFVLNKQLNALTQDLAEYVLKDIDKAITLKLQTHKDIKVT